MTAGEVEEPVDPLGNRLVVDVVHVPSGKAWWQSCSACLGRGLQCRDSFVPPLYR
jgi:hypothetical protein